MMKSLSNDDSRKALCGASELASLKQWGFLGASFHSPRHSCVDFISSIYCQQSQPFRLEPNTAETFMTLLPELIATSSVLQMQVRP